MHTNIIQAGSKGHVFYGKHCGEAVRVELNRKDQVRDRVEFYGKNCGEAVRVELNRILWKTLW